MRKNIAKEDERRKKNGLWSIDLLIFITIFGLSKMCRFLYVMAQIDYRLNYLSRIFPHFFLCFFETYF